MGNIETGVDRLVALVRERSKVSIDEAAKILKVPKETVHEWSEFLEENNVLTIEYGITQTYLNEKKLSDKDLERKEQEFSEKKNNFLKKAEITLLKLEDEKDTLEKLKDSFETLKSKLGGELEDVEKNYKKLKEYEVMDKQLEKEVFTRMSTYSEKINTIEKDMKKEENIYKNIVKEFDEETRKVLKDEKIIEDSEDKINDKLKELRGKKPKKDELAHEAYIKELIGFIKGELKKGLKKEQIKKQLKHVGWKPEEIEKLFPK